MNMFKYTLLLILTTTSSFANKIDSLNTDEEVLKFVWNFFPSSDKLILNFSDASCKLKYNDVKKITKWIKYDYDNNGELDLLVFNAINLPLIVIIKSIKGRYDINSTKEQFGNLYLYPEFTTIYNQNAILLYFKPPKPVWPPDTGKTDWFEDTTYKKLVCDTVILKDGLFLDYLKNPRKYDVEKIEVNFESGIEDGSKTNFNINPITFENKCTQELMIPLKNETGMLTKNEIQKITELLNYSNFVELSNHYSTYCFECGKAILKITYNGGKIKTIEDYGMSANFTLNNIYHILSQINWTEKK